MYNKMRLSSKKRPHRSFVQAAYHDKKFHIKDECPLASASYYKLWLRVLACRAFYSLRLSTLCICESINSFMNMYR